MHIISHRSCEALVIFRMCRCLCLERSVLEDNKDLENMLTEFQMPTMKYGTLKIAGFGETKHVQTYLFKIIKPWYILSLNAVLNRLLFYKGQVRIYWVEKLRFIFVLFQKLNLWGCVFKKCTIYLNQNCLIFQLKVIFLYIWSKLLLFPPYICKMNFKLGPGMHIQITSAQKSHPLNSFFYSYYFLTTQIYRYSSVIQCFNKQKSCTCELCSINPLKLFKISFFYLTDKNWGVL